MFATEADLLGEARCVGRLRRRLVARVTSVRIQRRPHRAETLAAHQQSSDVIEIEDELPRRVEGRVADDRLAIAQRRAHHVVVAEDHGEVGIAGDVVIVRRPSGEPFHRIRQRSRRQSFGVDDDRVGEHGGGRGQLLGGGENTRRVVREQAVVCVQQRHPRCLRLADALVPVSGEAEVGGVAHAADPTITERLHVRFGGLRAGIVDHHDLPVGHRLRAHAGDRFEQVRHVAKEGDREGDRWIRSSSDVGHAASRITGWASRPGARR